MFDASYCYFNIKKSIILQNILFLQTRYSMPWSMVSIKPTLKAPLLYAEVDK